MTPRTLAIPNSNSLAWTTALGESLDVGIMIVSKDRRIIFSNDIAHDLLGYPKMDDHIAVSVGDIVGQMSYRGDFGPADTPELLYAHQEKIEKFLQGNRESTFPALITPPNGKTLRFKRHDCGNNHVLVTIKDVSIRHKKDQVFKIALELGKSGYCTYNFDSEEISLNSGYLKRLLSPEEYELVRTKGLVPITHPDDIDDAKRKWENAIEKRQTYDQTFRIMVKNHPVKWFRFHARPIYAEDGRLSSAISFFEDVTDDFALQEDLRKAKDHAEKTLDAQNNFLARLSHEVRTPMNAVIGITDALIQHSPDKQILSKLKLIQSSADNIMNILDGTLSHNKLDADKLMLDPKPGNPRETVKSICALWEPLAKKNGTTIRCHIDDKTPKEITFDRFRYEQCLNNLLSNAVKFTPNGSVHVIMTLAGSNTPKPRLVLAVKDTGIGMTDEQQSRIFEAYTQADQSISSRFGGTGLGMNIAKRIIEMMGGSITVKSELGKGTIFALSLPVSAGAQEQEAPPQKLTKQNPVPRNLAPQKAANPVNITPPAAHKPATVKAAPPQPPAPKPVVTQPDIQDQSVDQETQTSIVDHLFEEKEKQEEENLYSNLKVIVADDNPTNHLVVESLLQTVVGTIYKANNGQEVLDLLEVHDVDMVLMDIHMPIMDGIEATLAIRSSQKHWSDVLIIAVTADPQYQQLRLCKNIGMDESLAKPIKLTTMLEAFDRVLTLDRAKAPYKDIYNHQSA